MMARAVSLFISALPVLSSCVSPAATTQQATQAGAVVSPAITATSTVAPTGTASPAPTLCVVLSPELCPLAELIHYQNAQNQTFDLIGALLPVGATVFSPTDSQASAPVQIKQPSPYQGVQVRLAGSAPGQTTFFMRGDVGFFITQAASVRKGDVIGIIQNTGIGNFNKYNFVLEADVFDPVAGKVVIDDKALQELFPGAFAKPANEVTYTGPSGSVVNVFETASPASTPHP